MEYVFHPLLKPVTEGAIHYPVIDYETTGLPSDDPAHEPYQIAWLVVTLDLETLTVRQSRLRCHWLKCNVPIERVSDYTKASAAYAKWLTVPENQRREPREVYREFLADLPRSEYIFQVGANPSFDREFIDRWQIRFGARHGMHRRPICTDQQTMHVLDTPYPVGLEDSMRTLFDATFNHPHEAHHDVRNATRVLHATFLEPWVARERARRLSAR